QGMKNVLERMRTAGVHRLIHLSFAGVRDGREQGGWLLNLVMVPLLHAVVADHEDRERLIKNSHVAWTLVRAIRLTDGPYTGRFRYGEAIQPRSWMPRISRADVAGLMLRLLDEPASIHKAYLATH